MWLTLASLTSLCIGPCYARHGKEMMPTQKAYCLSKVSSLLLCPLHKLSCAGGCIGALRLAEEAYESVLHGCICPSLYVRCKLFLPRSQGRETIGVIIWKSARRWDFFLKDPCRFILLTCSFFSYQCSIVAVAPTKTSTMIIVVFLMDFFYIY